MRLPGQELSSVELVVLAVVGAWIASAVWSRQMPQWRTHLTAPWLAFITTMAVAGAVSPHPENALHMVGRLVLAFTIYLMTVDAADTAGRRRAMTLAIVSAAAVAGVLVILESLGIAAVMTWLRLFRSDVALVGAQVRAGGPFQYPTIAAMFLEVAFALALGLLTRSVDADRRGLAVLVAATILLLAEALILTFTRAGLLAMASSLAIVGWLRYTERGLDRGARLVLAIGVVIAAQLFTSRSAESLRLRLMTEGQDDWYRAEVDAPQELAMAARTRVTVPITLTNTGGHTWDPLAAQPFRLSYHWLLPDADRVVSWEGLRTEFPGPVPPGATVTLRALIEAPRHPGRYRLLWDVEQEHRLWFSTEPGSTLAISRATVTGDGTGAIDLSSTLPLPRRAVRPRRPVLWRAAARMVADRPVLGVGPDNYRLLYGEYSGIVAADPRIHSNNMYLEVLAGGGLLGGLAFGWLAWRASQQARIAAAGVHAAVVAIALHGMFDSFLSFTPTYVLISITLGLASSWDATQTAHANRL